MKFLENLFIDRISYWVGFAVAGFFWWLWRFSKPTLSKMSEFAKERFARLQAGLSASAEQRFREDILKIVQERHLAASLFSLNELAIEPRVFAPSPAVNEAEEEYPHLDIVDSIIGYLPDWPEIGGVYQKQTMSLVEALGGDANLILIGKAGSGKSFALQWLTSLIARRDPQVGKLGNMIPFYIHAAELPISNKAGNELTVLYNAYYEIVSALTEAQLPAFLKLIFEEKLALLIVDGLDELPPTQQEPIIGFIQAIQEKYPGNRIIVTGSNDNIAAQEPLNAYPIAIAAWTKQETNAFIDHWADLWHEYTLNEPWAKELGPTVDPLVLKNWALANPHTTNPMLLTLIVWAAFAGDTRGLTPGHAIEAYIMRMSAGIPNARPAMEQLAVQMTLTMNAIIARNTAGKFVSIFEDPTAPSDLDVKEEVMPAVKPDVEHLPVEGLDDFAAELDSLLEESPELLEDTKKANPFIDGQDLNNLMEDINEEIGTEPEKATQSDKQQVRRMLPELVKSKILTYRANGMLSFSHPIFLGYLAGCGLATRGGANQMIPHPYWNGKTLAWEYYATKADIAPLANEMFATIQNDPLKRVLFVASTWARNGDPKAQWRGQVLRTVATNLQNDRLSILLRLKLVTALAFSGEKSIGQLFRQLMGQTNPDLQLLGALGVGLTKYDKAIPELGALLYAPNLMVNRAAALALVAIGSQKSLETATNGLLQANEEVRQAIAEALANDPNEGHGVLRDGATLDDILVRRATAYGLARVKQEWAKDILRVMQIDDDQWAVRSAAEIALQSINDTKREVPHKLPELHETTWLIGFAGQLGMGLSPGESSWKILKRVLEEGQPYQILLALDIYRQNPSQARPALESIYSLFYAQDQELRNAAYTTLWHIGAAGVDLPAPAQYGLV